MSEIRVALVTNALGPPTRGNGTTVHRWLGWLPDVGVRPIPLAPDFGLPPGRKPHVIHGYHAKHGGVHAARLSAEHGLPLVISLGGTDLYALRHEQEDTAQVRDVLVRADLVTGAFPGFGDDLRRLLGREVPYAVVPRGVRVGDKPPPTTREDQLRILLPAGIRPIKDPMLALHLIERLVEAGVPARLRIAGPVLDPAYAVTLDEALAACPHAERFDVPRSEMEASYEQADVVWNTSLHEGGPNALLEALASGCAVYARNVAGNRDLFGTPDAPGTLFEEDAADLVPFHRALRSETPGQRGRRVARARTWLRRHHDSLTEARALRAAYERILD